MRRILLLLSVVLCANAAFAAVAVPLTLEPWRAWALHGLDRLGCPQPADQAFDPEGGLCAWPGELRIDADASGAVFSQEWRLQAPAWVPLPGSAERWPQGVRANGQALVVVARAGQPMAWLGAGRQRIEGRLAWAKRPEILTVPVQAARIALSVDGRAVALPEREGAALRLGREASVAPEADALKLRVFRRVQDGLPLLLETRIELYGAGQLREERLPQVLPEGFVPLTLDSDWPARLEPDGSLRVQVQADSAELILLARATALPQTITRPETGAPWPAQEIWSYQPDARLRGTRASAALEVDPRRAEVPADWTDLQAFALAPGQALSIEERGRGEAAASGNRLQLKRSLWLDHDGAGYSLRDQLSGEMRQGWRLQAQPPLTLESARSGSGEPLLITELDESARRGLEWRSGRVDVAAELRVDARVPLPLAGWNQRFERVDIDLNLPAGYRLLSAPGAEPGAQDWLSRWRLLDVFLVAVLGLLAWHALGAVGTAVTLGLLTIGYHEPGLPLLAIGLALGAGLLARALDRGRLGAVTRWINRAALLLLVLLALPFAINQARLALYPQLEARAAGLAPPPADFASMQSEAAAGMPAAPAPPSAPLGYEDQNARLDRISVTGTRIKGPENFEGYSQSTVMQAGRALPQWQSGNRHALRYPGPVTADEPLRLSVLSPWAVRGLRLLVLALFALLLWQLLGKPRLPRSRAADRAGVGRAATATALLLPLLLISAAAPPVNAQTAAPSAELLQELRQRLTQPPACAPQCAQVAEVTLQAEGDSMLLELEVHLLQGLALPLPQPQSDQSAALVDLRLNGQPSPELLGENGRWLMPLAAGVQRVQMRLRADADRLTLLLPLRPGRVSLSGEGWQLAGVDEDGAPQAGSVQLLRLRAVPGQAEAEAPAQTFPAYVRIVRELNLDTQWRLRSRVERMAPMEGDLSVEVPLLEGERVGSPGLRVRQGRISLVLADGDDSIEWESQLDRTSQLSLSAPALDPQVAEWRIAVGPMWRVEFSGVPESLDPQTDGEDRHVFVFHPRAAETLRLEISEPQAAPGPTLALERMNIVSELGQRARDHRIELVLRSTVGGEHRLPLPAGTELVEIRRDGQPLRLSARDGALDLPLQPGTHSYALHLREDRPIGLMSRSPPLDPGLAAANISYSLQLPPQRWLLWTSGPRQGPAVLYWGELAVLLLLAAALSRLPHSPLRLWQWLLLALGFSAVSVYALLLIAAWLFACAWRQQQTPERLGGYFNAAQVGLLLLTALALLALLAAVPLGLLGQPDMRIEGNGSSASQLRWFVDRHEGVLPTPTALSLPILVYRGLMLAWALWLAASVIGWLRVALAAWTSGGYWRPWRRRGPPPVPPTAARAARPGE